MTGTRLPDGFVVRLASRTRVRESGRVLVGGAPTRVTRLTPAAARLITSGELVVRDARTRRLAELLVASGLADPIAARLPPVDLGELTVVVPVHDRARQLTRLLASIPGGVAETIVVDDASRDGLGIADAARRHRATLVRRETNGGPAAARNLGLSRVATRFVAFVDSDVTLEEGALATLLRHTADPRVALVAPRVVGAPTEAPNALTRYEDARSSLDLGDDAALVRPGTPVSWVSSTCLVGRVDLLGEGFDAALRVGEDVDLVWRLVEHGLRIRFEPSAAVRHDHRTRIAAWAARKRFYGTGAHLLAVRHPGHVAPAILPLWGVALLALVALQRPWATVGAAGILAVTVVRNARRIAHIARPWSLALDLTARSAAATLTQGSALVLRHWWPVAAVAALLSRRARRIVVVAGVADAAVEYARLRPRLDPVRFALARRLDDVAYGTGVWTSVVRGRSLRALLPRIVRG
ncbi:mycofactocin biosynthesis glycosyltransferase MftF [Microbacterium sp. G2-8]|uniref:mycofactocin biosynthesis glycosyltransferase MftF n=1 Tax=Microbacterium sp. G2-8 TaxID=2842454 RepID=UPI001C8A3708|nr:mycofactocin biosynthesis glycosyltransferase MftF [Microbacterium sp. G2-8]